MPTLIGYHSVDDVDHWLASPKRDEFFGGKGISVRTFTAGGDSKQVALILEVPDMEVFDAAMQSEEAAAAMKHDGVNPETLVILNEA